MISPLVDALIERGESRRRNWPALTGLESDQPEVFGFTFLLDSLARLRLAQGRVPEALHLARECAASPARVGHLQPRVPGDAVDARRRARRERANG